jgi:LacI family transcriptional regulator
MKETTIYDIANALNISPATVSRALKKHPAISEKTCKKVDEMAKAMNYRSNTFASSLRKKYTKTIGVIVPRLNSYFVASVLAGIEKVLNEFEYNLIISQSLESKNKELINVQTMFRSRVDGLIVSLASDTDEYGLFNQFLDHDIPLIFFDRVPQEISCPQVVIDNFAASYEMTQHMLSKKCKQLAFVTGNLQRNVYYERLEGFKAAMKYHSVDFDPEHLIVNDMSEQAGIQAAEKLLSLKAFPDGIIVTNDTCAASLINRLKKAGKRIPEDALVAGFNNDPISRLTNPSITTINYPGLEMGEAVANHLLNQLQGKAGSSMTNKVILRTELIVRESTNRI